MPPNLKIGNLELNGCAFLAPMAGVSNSPMRRTASRMGAAAVSTEMTSAEGLLKAKGEARNHFFQLLAAHPEERPLSVQLFGSDPAVMARAAGLAAETNADIVDINMGCPVKKVVRRGEGAALMKDPARVKIMVREMKKAIGKAPLTVKMRSGFSANEVNAVEICRIAEGEGADAVIVHPRTREQGFTGKANWQVIRLCVQAVKIPVIGNGDIKNHLDAARMLTETGCRGVMIGRAALGNPWIFRQFKSPNSAPPSPDERRQMILWHLELLENLLGGSEAVIAMRKHLIWYSKGMDSAIEFRRGLVRIKTREQLLATVNEFFEKKAISPVREMGD